MSLPATAINDAKAYVTGRRLIETARTAAKKLVADPSFPLKDPLNA